MEIFEDSRTVSRADLAAWLRQMAGQLESDGKVLFGAAGSVTVSDEVHCELEIESSGSETSIEIEFSWTGAASETSEDEDEEEEEDEESGEDAEADSEAEADAGESAEESATEDEPATQPTAVGVASVAPAQVSNAPASPAYPSSFVPSTPAAEVSGPAEDEMGGGDARPVSTAH